MCLVTDPAVPKLELAVEQALAAGVTMLHLRGHGLSAAQLYALALRLRPLCQDYGATFIINDRLDVGLAVGADGFQLGTRSLPLAVARRVVGEAALLGASVHSLAEARVAVASGADFLLVGTIFATRSHPERLGSGPDIVCTIREALPTASLLAIGGINTANAESVMAAGADGVAVISEILGAAQIARAVAALRHAIGLE